MRTDIDSNPTNFAPETGNVVPDVPSRHKTLITLLFVALVLLDFAVAVMYGSSNSIDVPTFHLDGAYQTASGLYRISEGEWPGRDFLPYLGVGLVWAMYPIFLLAGKNVAASVLASYLATLCAAALSFGVLATLLAKRNRILQGAIAGSIFLLLASWFFPDLANEIAVRIKPGASLRPLRSFLPYGVAGLLYLMVLLRWRPLPFAIGLGVISGASFLWTNDFGVPVSGGLLVFGALLAYRNGSLRLPLIATAVATAVAVASLGLTIGTHGHAWELLHYNFMDVRQDQYWYFGPWHADARILSFSDLFTKLLLEDMYPWSVVGLAFAVWRTWRQPTLEHALWLFIGLMLMAGGVLATLGGHRGYMASLEFWSKSSLLLWIVFALAERIPARLALRPATVLGATLLLALAIAAATAGRLHTLSATAAADPQRFFVPELGGYLPQSMHRHVELARTHAGAAVIEEYWGIWSSVAHIHANTPVDSVIHALGGTRTRFAAAAAALPDFFITTTHQMAPKWQGWGLSANWWFYSTILQHYEPEQTSPNTLLWRRAAIPAWPAVNCRVEQQPQPAIRLDGQAPGLYEVTLDYDASELGSRSLLLVRNNLVRTKKKYVDYLSLYSRSPSAVFPVLVRTTGEPLDVQVTSAYDVPAQVHLRQCTARHIVLTHPEVFE